MAIVFSCEKVNNEIIVTRCIQGIHELRVYKGVHRIDKLVYSYKQDMVEKTKNRLIVQ
jgi:hypothetical protein